jgi:glycosyltransferase involved in cell wall biosynthesis
VEQPVVSVIMPSYNHASVVAEAVESVLSQSFGNFEFLIEDDGSTDGTADVLKAFSDPRIKLVVNARNEGAGMVTNRLVSRSSGRYVALINSDDIWVTEKLSRQVGWLDPNVELAAVFSYASFIDEQGGSLNSAKLSFGNVFEQVNRSRGRWLRQFLYDGNCLCSPSVMVRREALIRAGSFDNRLRQLPDLDMWTRMAKRERFHVYDTPLVKFRIWRSGGNVSSGTPENEARTILEHMLIAENIFRGVDDDMMREGFRELLRYPEIPTPVHREIEETLLYFAEPAAAYARTLKLLGYRKLYALLGRPATRGILIRDYGIDDRFFQGIGSIGSIFR